MGPHSENILFIILPEAPRAARVNGGMRIALLLCVPSLTTFTTGRRTGIAGADTVRAPSFTGTLNGPSNKFHIPGAIGRPWR